MYIECSDCCWILYSTFVECKYETAYILISWNRILCSFLYHLSNFWKCSVLYLLNWTILVMSKDLGRKLCCAWCLKRLVQDSNLYTIRQLFLLTFFYHIFSSSVLFPVFIFMFFPCWSEVNWRPFSGRSRSFKRTQFIIWRKLSGTKLVK
jgi:hypothetical protein